jgi:hypothetical protein
MSEEVQHKTVMVEKRVVELKVEVSEDFFKTMEKAKKEVADKRGYDVSFGEYIEEAMNDLVLMVDEYGAKLIEASKIIHEQDEALGKLEVEEPVDPETGEVEAEVPDELYAHIIEDTGREVMYQ